MYLYYDKYGVLKEIINDKAITQNNDSVNVVYVYYELINVAVDMRLIITKNDGTTENREMTYVRNEEEQEIPYDNTRELKYFKYGVKYDFMKYALVSGDLDVAGIIKLEPYVVFINSNETLGAFIGSVVASKIQPTESINDSEYQDLLNTISRKEPINVNYSNVSGDEDLLGFNIYDFYDVNIDNSIKYFTLLCDLGYMYFSNCGLNKWQSSVFFLRQGHLCKYYATLSGTTLSVKETPLDVVDYKVANDTDDLIEFGDLDNYISASSSLTTFPENLDFKYVSNGNSMRIRFSLTMSDNSTYITFAPTIHFSSKSTSANGNIRYTYECSVSNSVFSKANVLVIHFNYTASTSSWRINFIGLPAIKSIS